MIPAADLPRWLIDGIANTVLSDLPTPMAVLNLQLRHVVANDALGRLYGRDARSLTGATPPDLLGPLGDEIATRCASVVATGRAVRGQLVSGTRAPAGGPEVHWQLDCTALPTDAGAPGALLVTVTDVTARTHAMRRLNDERRTLAHRATHDPLTGAPNRYHLRQVLQQRLDRGRTPRVLAIDLDGFKAVNDQHGHAAGDVVLMTVTDRLIATLRVHDVVCRYGGDEFVVLTEADVGPTSAFVDRLVEVISEPIEWEGQLLEISASIGSVEADPDDDVDDVLNRADEAMYTVKQRRRSGLVDDVEGAGRPSVPVRPTSQPRLDQPVADPREDLDPLFLHVPGDG